MKCDKVQKLILSDYTDSELDARSKKMVEDHLKECSACRLFRERLQNAVIAPLKGAGRLEPPESLWYRIKARIEEREAQSPAAVLLDRLRGLLVPARPALAAVVLSLMLIVTAVAVHRIAERNALNTFIAEQADFMASLANGNGNGNGDPLGDIGIPMEDFFV